MTWRLFAVEAIGVVGLALLGYGLWLVTPWLGFAVVGGLMLAAAVLAGRHLPRESS